MSPLSACLSRNCEATIIPVHLCSCVSKWKPRDSRLYSRFSQSSCLLHSIGLKLKAVLQYVYASLFSHLWWLLQLPGDNSWLSTAGQIHCVCVIIQVYFPMSHTAIIGAHISMHLVKCINIVFGQIVLLYIQLSQSTLVKWNVIDHHFVAAVCGYTFLHICWPGVSGWRLEIIPPSV